MTENKHNHNATALLIAIIQLIVWSVILLPFFETPTGDAAGMGKGLAILFVTMPGMLLIFLSNLYFVTKRAKLKPYYTFLSIANIMGLLILFYNIN